MTLATIHDSALDAADIGQATRSLGSGRGLTTTLGCAVNPIGALLLARGRRGQQLTGGDTVTFESGLNHNDDVRALLAELIRSTDGESAALLRLDGTCRGVAGDTAQVNPQLLAALVAEMISCCRNVAQAFGEDRFCTVMQQGVDRHVHVTLVDDAHALVVAFADHRQTGVVRLLSQRTAERIGELLSEPVMPVSDCPASSIPPPMSRSVDLLDRIFQTSPQTKPNEGAH